jgi:FtsZ-binding cell division protein ZapB
MLGSVPTAPPLSTLLQTEINQLKIENEKLKKEKDEREQAYSRLEADYEALKKKMNDIEFYYKILMKKLHILEEESEKKKGKQFKYVQREGLNRFHFQKLSIRLKKILVNNLMYKKQ